MRKVVGGLIQMSNPINDPNAPVAKISQAMEEKHLPYIEEAGKQGVQILCLQEVFNGPYFCPSPETSATPSSRRASRPLACTSAMTATSPRELACWDCTAPRSSSIHPPR